MCCQVTVDIGRVEKLHLAPFQSSDCSVELGKSAHWLESAVMLERSPVRLEDEEKRQEESDEPCQ